MRGKRHQPGRSLRSITLNRTKEINEESDVSFYEMSNHIMEFLFECSHQVEPVFITFFIIMQLGRIALSSLER